MPGCKGNCPREKGKFFLSLAVVVNGNSYDEQEFNIQDHMQFPYGVLEQYPSTAPVHTVRENIITTI